MSKRFPGRKLSLVRLALLILVAGVVGVAAFDGWNRFADARAASSGEPWFAGYVDATATPFYAFEDPSGPAEQNVVLSFIVADHEDGCRPSWGGAYSLDEAAATMDLDRRIARLAGSGGKVVISFGGLNNDELPAACTDPDWLLAASRTVVDRYQPAAIDPDIEGDDLANAEAGKRRAAAIAALQQEHREAGKDLKVWLTLPVAPTGLTPEGTAAVEQMLAGGAALKGVNIMTMDYGGSRGPSQSMLGASVAAARATHGQLTVLYRRAGEDVGEQTLWRRIGLTPMIGQNDVVGEVFDLEAPAGLNAFAREHGVGRMSMWSLNRDQTCSENYGDTTRVSDSCSGVDQGGSSFAQVLANGMGGAAGTLDSAPEPAPSPSPAATVVDDPETSPYPIWSEEASYVAEDRVVWKGKVYEAKWWTRGDVPNNPVLQASETPWSLIGPVLPGETPMPVVTAPAGLYPQWSPDRTYEKGDRVLYEGRIFEAKWWTRSDTPEAARQGSDSSPWAMFDNEQTEKVIAGKAGKSE
ncbi:glycosyl hydrolase family 18 [Arthrobacter deserti]|uniref:Glycosyl hydrolase family 18 n=1 Tax=Arthrobacter deserti TaxID=1742687 RepID=A0ABX1JIK4_9MICC|nr:glycosyl hydrolase family 18 [Arthrobacter deserti]